MDFEESRNVRIDYRNTENQNDRLPALAADLPVQQASKFELVINLNAAKALKLDLPTSILLRANELIE